MAGYYFWLEKHEISIKSLEQIGRCQLAEWDKQGGFLISTPLDTVYPIFVQETLSRRSISAEL